MEARGQSLNPVWFWLARNKFGGIGETGISPPTPRGRGWRKLPGPELVCRKGQTYLYLIVSRDEI